MDRQDFMSFFRNTEKLNTLSTEDRVEVFSSVLSGSSDITVELLQGLLVDYGVDDVVVHNKKELFDRFPILSSEPIATTKTQTEKEDTPQQLIVGNWYTYKEGNCDWLMNYQGEGNVCYGFNTDEYWSNGYTMSGFEGWKPATTEEIETALIREVKKRGYKEGQIIKSFVFGTSNLSNNNGQEFRFEIQKNRLWYYGNILFQDGEWAEVIEEQPSTDGLIPNRWYTLKENAGSILIFIKDSKDTSNNYGFRRNGSWFENMDSGWTYATNPQEWREATEEEVEKAMINHFKENYHGNRSTCLHRCSSYEAQENYELSWDKEGQCLRYWLNPGGVGCVYDNGEWADLITVDTEKGEVFYEVDIQKNTELTVGKWYKNLTYEGSYFLYEEKNDSYYKGCGVVYEGSWYHNGNWGLDDSYREATQQEIEEILIKEARRRGYKEGQTIVSFILGTSNLSNNNGQEFRFDIQENRLWYYGNILFQDGEWAEIIYAYAENR